MVFSEVQYILKSFIKHKKDGLLIVFRAMNVIVAK